MLRFLLLLLSEDGAEQGTILLGADGSTEAPDSANNVAAFAVPLFESLVQTLDRNPQQLDQVAKLIQDLGDSAERLLPDGFHEVWTPIWAARRRLAT